MLSIKDVIIEIYCRIDDFLKKIYRGIKIRSRGFQLPVCHFKRAYFFRIFKGDATYGYCAAKDEKYYGFKGHVLISLSGLISSFTLNAANVEA